VQIQIFNIRGQFSRNLVNGNLKAGDYTQSWNGTDNGNQRVPSGMYLIRMESGKMTNVGKVVVVVK